MKYITLLKNTLRTIGIAGAMFSLLGISFIYAQEGHDMSVSDVLSSIATVQGVSDERDIVCEDVSDKNLELLGDALMGRMINNDNLHTQMDNMMGGEGSDTLTAMHENLARTYLGCSDTGFGMGMMMGGGMMQSMMGGGSVGIMGGGMMQPQEFGTNRRSSFNNSNTLDSMMGFNTMGGLGFGGFGGVVMIAFWLLVIAGVVLLIKKFMSRDVDTQNRNQHTSSSALDILKERYARGEIDQKEFEQKKKDLM